MISNHANKFSSKAGIALNLRFLYGISATGNGEAPSCGGSVEKPSGIDYRCAAVND
jgi:hypothetical protein